MKTVLLKGLLLISATFLFLTASRAVPAYNGKVVLTQPDGSRVECQIVGDESWHVFVSTDDFLMQRDANGYLQYVESSRGRLTTADIASYRAEMLSSEQSSPNGIRRVFNRRNATPIPNGNFPTTGNVKGLVLLVEFSDNSFNASYTRDVFQGLMNTENFSQFGAQGSSRDYFVSQSMGQFTPQFDVVGPLKLSQPMSYYGGDDDLGPDAKAGEMIADACRAADEQGIDFSQYDYNNDGMVDFVFVIYAGYGQNYGADANTIWPHTASLPDWEINLTLDGKQVGRYACSCELKYNSGTQLEGIGTFCHEFGHVLGLKDIYDTRHSNNRQVGVWSIMDQGCYNNESRTPCAYSAFERWSLGWLELTELDTPSDNVTLAELTQNNVAYRISTSRENEFFTLENRQQVGWDAYLPGKGMMITHIDYDQIAWNNNTVNNGDDCRLLLVPADGNLSADTYQTDLYPSVGNDKFTDNSTPNSLIRNGTATGKPVTQIRDVEGTIYFRFMQDALPKPEPPIVDDVQDGSLTCHWDEVAGAVGYRLEAVELIAADENPLVVDEDFDKMTAGSYSNPDAAEMGTVLDAYTNLQGWSGNALRQAGGYLYVGEGGELMSPLVDVSEPDGQFTVGISCKAEQGTSAKFKIVAARNTGKEITSTECEVGSDEQTIVVTMTGGIARTRLKVVTTEGSIYINRLRVMKGEVAEADIWNDVVHTVVADGITATSHTLTGLKSDTDYNLTLTALAADPSLNSEPSAAVLVHTKYSTAIAETKAQGEATYTYYNIYGQEVTPNTNGLYIEKATAKDGTMIVRKVVRK